MTQQINHLCRSGIIRNLLSITVPLKELYFKNIIRFTNFYCLFSINFETIGGLFLLFHNGLIFLIGCPGSLNQMLWRNLKKYHYVFSFFYCTIVFTKNAITINVIY